ncbi:hypothetical protein JTE90_027903 [Oedothorax gibbosus]|uniref:Gustatory receptor n=1 Tax=Oedothorax gibbosus TaxID=931172 RepID=A0AAV6UBK0_9ARAC|nr:hypothetical protein JTE90_027903 [Oedothorax gibbosus]
MFRMFLYLRSNGLRQIASIFNERKMRKSLKVSTWIKVWIGLNILAQILNLVFYTRMVGFQFREGFEFMVRFKEPYPSIFAVVASAVHYLFFIMPFNTFALFYVIVCHHAKQIIDILGNSMPVIKERNVNLDALLATHNRMVKIVERIDSELSAHVFFCTVFNSVAVYGFISSFIHENYHGTSRYRHLMICFCATSLSSFFAMTVAAALVNEALAQIATQARSMQAENIHSKMSLQILQFCTSHPANLTVWNIVTIKRGVFINTLGVIFTYVLLIDSLDHSK